MTPLDWAVTFLYLVVGLLIVAVVWLWWELRDLQKYVDTLGDVVDIHALGLMNHSNGINELGEIVGKSVSLLELHDSALDDLAAKRVGDS